MEVAKIQAAAPAIDFSLRPQALGNHSLLSDEKVSSLLRRVDFLAFTIIYSIVVRFKVGIYPTLYLSKRFALLAILLGASLWVVQAQHLDRIRSGFHCVARLIVAATLAGSALGVVFYLFSPEVFQAQYGVYSRSIILTILGLFVAVGSAVRLVIWRWINRATENSRWLLITGQSDPGVTEFYKEWQSKPENQLTILTQRHNDIHPPLLEANHGLWQDLKGRLKEPWTGMIISGHVDLPPEIIHEVFHAKLHGLPVFSLSDFYERYWSKVPVSHLDGEWLALSSGFDLLHSTTQVQLKRFTDILFAGGLLLLASPVILLVALLVKLTSSGPVLFRQTRVGIHGNNFTCLKFRTMFTGSEKGNKYTQKADSRITPIGKILRKTRLDELPQLINVLKGEMSFIGPRAEWDVLVDDYEKELPYYHLRHLVRPGLTGWAQVNYPYGANLEDTRKKFEYDLYYIKHYDLLLDLVIILRTIRVCLFGFGAR
jgi:exopolysaccharide biosynthesis polyprenyl glycosylphosphotransferase